MPNRGKLSKAAWDMACGHLLSPRSSPTIQIFHNELSTHVMLAFSGQMKLFLDQERFYFKKLPLSYTSLTKQFEAWSDL